MKAVKLAPKTRSVKCDLCKQLADVIVSFGTDAHGLCISCAEKIRRDIGSLSWQIYAKKVVEEPAWGCDCPLYTFYGTKPAVKRCRICKKPFKLKGKQ